MSRAEEFLNSRGFKSGLYQDWLAIRIAESSGRSRIPMHILAGIALGDLRPMSIKRVKTRYYNALNRRFMSDSFIASRLGLGVSGLPKCLIELKRTQLRVKRLAREIEDV
jgi:hypothetical protein